MYGYIYKITNNLNGKTYIGKHKSDSTKNWMNDKYMSSSKILWLYAYPKYGIENFTKALICEAVDLKHLNALEKYWIAEYRSRGKAEYNITSGGDGGNGGANKGKSYHYTKDSKKRLAANKGKVAWNRGKPFSEETCKKMAISHTGKKLTKEHRLHQSEAHKDIPHAAEHNANVKRARQEVSKLYKDYKAKGGNLLWNEFNHMIKQEKK